MARAAVPRALDLDVPQVAVDYFDDEGGFPWHHRLLLVKLGEGSRWAAATPTHEIEVVNLDQHRVVPLVRGAEVPPRCREGFFGFDPVGDDELAALLKDARPRLTHGDTTQPANAGISTAQKRGIHARPTTNNGASGNATN